MQAAEGAVNIAARIQRQYSGGEQEGRSGDLPLATLARVPLAESSTDSAEAVATPAQLENPAAPNAAASDSSLADEVTERVYRLMCREVRQGFQRGERLR